MPEPSTATITFEYTGPPQGYLGVFEYDTGKLVEMNIMRDFRDLHCAEGWADALDMLIVAYMGDDSDPWVSTVEGMYLEFDYQAIRPKGTPLVTSGGLAPGHVPLKICLERVRAILDQVTQNVTLG